MKQAEMGLPVADLIRQIGVSEQTLYQWKRQYGGLESDQVRELKQVVEEGYNTERPHSSLGYATPAAFAADLALQGAAPLRAAGSYAPQPLGPPAQSRDNNNLSLVPAG